MPSLCSFQTCLEMPVASFDYERFALNYNTA
jgi:hypothetical protein